MSIHNWLKFGALGLLWGSAFLWIKLAIREIGPFTVVTFQVLFASLGMLVFAGLARARRPGGSSSRIPFSLPAGQIPWKAFILMGLGNIIIPFGLVSWGAQHIDASLASILNSTAPLFTILIAPLFLLDERLTPARLVGLLAGFLGVVVLLGKSSGGLASSSAAGQAAVLAAAFFTATSAVYARRSARDIPWDSLALGQVVSGAVLMSVAGPLLEAPFTLPRLPLTWLALAWLGLMASCLGTLIYFSLLSSAGATRAVLVSYVFPLVGVLLGILVLGEPLNWRIIAGGVLIISGIVAVNSLSSILGAHESRS